MKTKILVVKNESDLPTANTNYLDFYNGEEAATLLLALNWYKTKYEVTSFTTQIPLDLDIQDQTVIRIFIGPNANSIKQGFDLFDKVKFTEELIRVDAYRRAEFAALVEELNGLF